MLFVASLSFMEDASVLFHARKHSVWKTVCRASTIKSSARPCSEQSKFYKDTIDSLVSPLTRQEWSAKSRAPSWYRRLLCVCEDFDVVCREGSGREYAQQVALESSIKYDGSTGKTRSVERVSSWSQYVEACGGEEPVETAREWMIDLSQLLLGHKFASGTYSRLYHGVYKQKSVAVKVMKPPKEDEVLSSQIDQQFSHEVALLSRLHHGNIVEFVAACKKPPVFCVLTEYLSGGSLKTFLHKSGPYSLSLDLVTRIALDVARGMDYLHSQGVIHRDLKSENLIMTDDLHIKVADFGVSCLESHRNSMKGYMGTYRWMAPEMIKGKPCSRKVDVYSFGIVLWELLTGLTPFAEMTAVQVAYAVSHKNARPPLPVRCPIELGRLMQRCWSTNPVKRPEFCQIIKILEHFEASLSQEVDGASENSFQKPSLFGCCKGVPVIPGQKSTCSK